MVPDQRAALDFYRGLFGWQGEPGPPETGGYAVCTLNGKAVAGIVPTMAPEGQPTPPTAWTSYLATGDADATAQAITDNGGGVLMPAMDVLTFGRMLVAADATGAVFGVWQARDFIGSQVVNEPGAVIWTELNTTDPDAAKAFYPALGIEVAPMEGAPGYFSLTVAGRMVGGMQGLDQFSTEIPSHWMTYFSVDDTDGTVDALTQAGGSVLKGPFDMMAGRMAVVQDPQGAAFAVIKPSGPQTA
jgi:hypothetical protein